ncbi:hypothetical protein GCM10023081_40100 [Arthrobacter ginkgonis]|uniref:Uncharacterized protein n=1 Tax=Arthrobacter ginkgonis TaxID=1630594 RepID=A0ABP7D3R8_9MICC
MRVIETVHAEPRDVTYSPCYRVNFWQQPPPGHSWPLDAYALTEVEDVTEVLRWVTDHANGRLFEVFAEIDDEPEGSFQTSRKTGLVRLLGTNPNAGETTEFARFKKM